MRHSEDIIATYQPKVFGDVTPTTFAERMTVCGNCQQRRFNRCAVAKQLVTILARKGDNQCFHWPGDQQVTFGGIKNWEATEQLTVSVVVISHNYGRFLPESLESVFNQTHPPDEVLLIDDASDDNTPEFATRSGVDYHRVEYRNVHDSRREDSSGPRATC